MGVGVEQEVALQSKIGKKSKKSKKNVVSGSEEARDSTDIVPNRVEASLELSKKGKKKKKHDKKHEVSSLVQFDDEVVNVKDYAEVNDSYKKEKDRKKKERKIEAGKDEASKNVARMEGEKMSVEKNVDKDLGHECLLKNQKDEKKRHKKKRKKEGSDTLSSMESLEDTRLRKDDVVKLQKSFGKGDGTEMKNGEEWPRKRKKGKETKGDCEPQGYMKITDAKEVEKRRDDCDGNTTKKVERKKRKREKKQEKDDLGAGLQEITAKKQDKERTNIEDAAFLDNQGNDHSSRNKMLDRETKNSNKGKRKKLESIENSSKSHKLKGKSKKVRFSGDIEVFPLPEDSSFWEEMDEEVEETGEEGELVQGKRYSRAEDAKIKKAVYKYIATHNLGEEGLNMVLHCNSYPEIRNCWKEIGAVLPWRPYQSIYNRAHNLFERGDKRVWTPEELELVREFHGKHGPDWRKLADELGRHRSHVKDTWRRIKPPNMKEGNWSQEEYQTLFDLVNMDLQMKAFEEKHSKHGMLRDNICWGAISDKLSTRSNAICCLKWYRQLTSPLVAEGKWTDTDDYRLLAALFSLDACCIEDVDWDNLIDHRSGDVCLKRWNQMARHLGNYKNKSFAEQVEILSQRYCPNLLEAREIWDKKPVVP